MRSLDCFIVKPLGERYNNDVEVGEKKLITNANIESFRHINKKAVIVETPKNFKSPIKKGDVVLIHHNIFRRYYGMSGKEKNGSTYFKDDMYFAYPEQIYVYQKDNKWYTNENYCFVAPIKETDHLKPEKEQKHIGILKYGNSELEALNISPGDLVGFKPLREFEFVFNKQRLYCMKSNDIVIKYERRGNEKEYNPSWAESS
jgi:hypothetical protein